MPSRLGSKRDGAEGEVSVGIHSRGEEGLHAGREPRLAEVGPRRGGPEDREEDLSAVPGYRAKKRAWNCSRTDS